LRTVAEDVQRTFRVKEQTSVVAESFGARFPPGRNWMWTHSNWKEGQLVLSDCRGEPAAEWREIRAARGPSLSCGCVRRQL